MNLDPDLRRRPTGVNVPDDERLVSVLFGTAATLLATRRGGALGAVLGAGGLGLIARGVTGRCPVLRSRVLGRGVFARRSITIQASRAEVYRAWRDLAGLPRFLEHVTEVIDLDGERSRWIIKEGPLQLSWEARITDDVPERRIAWESVPGSSVENAGSVELHDAPGGRGTEMVVTIHYRPPGGVLVGAPLRGLFRRFTRHQLDVELHRLRQLLETGEVAFGAPNRAMLPAHDARALAEGRM